LPDRDAAADLVGQGLAAARDWPGQRAAGGDLRRRADGLRAVRADGPVRPLAEDAHLARAVPVLPARHVQAPEVVHPFGKAQMSDPLLSAKNLSVRFGGVLAVNNVSFDVMPGEVFTLIGPNGAGKTTVFNLISRIYTPT